MSADDFDPALEAAMKNAYKLRTEAMVKVWSTVRDCEAQIRAALVDSAKL
ncbi:MAG: hypothetical protein ACREBW_05835 [Candidatus Micrarchaeaceae archaeon]